MLQGEPLPVQQPTCFSCMSEGQSCCCPRAWGDSWAMVVSSSLGRRVASVTQPSQSESPSCSPFGKKKKCKDKYLAKHSSSKCEQGSGLNPQPWPSLPLGRAGSVLHGRTQTAQLCQQWNLRILHSHQLFFRVSSAVFMFLMWPQLCPHAEHKARAGSALSSCALPCANPLHSWPCELRPPSLKHRAGSGSAAAQQSGISLNSHSCQGLSLVRQGTVPQPPMQAPHAELSKELAEVGAWGLLAPGPACSSNQQQTRL